MQKLPKKVILPLLKGTNERVTLLNQSLPREEQYLFRIEGIEVLTKWNEYYDRVLPVVDSKQDFIKLSNKDCYTLAFYCHHMAAYFIHVGHQTDLEYAGGVDYLFKNFKKQMGERNQEKLFWNVFKKD